MIKNFVIAPVVSAAMIGTSWAFWQEAATPSRTTPNPGLAGGGRYGVGPLPVPADPTVTLLRTREVQTELKLEEDKAKKLDEIDAAVTREREQIAAEYRTKLTEMNKKAEDRALALLSEAQRQRTEQLRLQQQGLRAFSTNSVAEKLGLSQTQRDEIAKLNERVVPFRGGLNQDGTNNPPNPNDSIGSIQDRIRQLTDEANKRAAETREKILAVLTPQQKAKWSEMTGETFQFPSRQRSTPRGTSTRFSEPAKPSAEKKDQ